MIDVEEVLDGSKERTFNTKQDKEVCDQLFDYFDDVKYQTLSPMCWKKEKDGYEMVIAFDMVMNNSIVVLRKI